MRVILRHVAGKLDLSTKRIACLMAMPIGPRSPSARSTRITPGVAPGEAAMDLAEQFRGCFRVENEFSGRPGRVEALRPFSGVAGCMDTPCDSSSASVPE